MQNIPLFVLYQKLEAAYNFNKNLNSVFFFTNRAEDYFFVRELYISSLYNYTTINDSLL